MKVNSILNIGLVRMPVKIKPASEPKYGRIDGAMIAPLVFSNEVKPNRLWNVDIAELYGPSDSFMSITCVCVMGRTDQEAWSLAVIRMAKQRPAFAGLTKPITLFYVGARPLKPTVLAYPEGTPQVPNIFEFEPGKPLYLDAYPISKTVRLPFLTPIRK